MSYSDYDSKTTAALLRAVKKKGCNDTKVRAQLIRILEGLDPCLPPTQRRERKRTEAKRTGPTRKQLLEEVSKLGCIGRHSMKKAELQDVLDGKKPCRTERKKRKKRKQPETKKAEANRGESKRPEAKQKKKGGGRPSKLWKAGQSIYKREEEKRKVSQAVKKEKKLREDLIRIMDDYYPQTSFWDTMSTSQLSEVVNEVERRWTSVTLPTKDRLYDMLHANTKLAPDMMNIIADMAQPWCKDQEELDKYVTRLKRYGVELKDIVSKLPDDMNELFRDQDDLEPDQVVLLVDNVEFTNDPESRLFSDLDELYDFLTSTPYREVKYFKSRKRYWYEAFEDMVTMDQWLAEQHFYGDATFELFRKRLEIDTEAEEPYFQVWVLHCIDLELVEKAAKHNFYSRKASSTGR
jgi:hypothetical protein